MLPWGRVELLPLVIAEASQPAFALVYVADAKGFLREEGLEVSFNKFVLGRDALASAVAGKSDIATVFETPVVIGAYEGLDIAVISTLHTSRRGHALIALRERGVQRAADLPGRRVGVSSGTAMDYFLSLLLTTEGIPPKSIQRVPIEPARYEAALVAGEVDALVAFGPHAMRLPARLGEDKVAVIYSDLYVETSLLAGRREVLEAKAEAMRRLIRAILRAQDFARKDAEETAKIVVRRLAGADDEQTVRRLLAIAQFEAKLDNVLLSALAQQAQWLRETGRYETPPPDFSKVLMRRYLRAERPAAVTVPSRDP